MKNAKKRKVTFPGSETSESRPQTSESTIRRWSEIVGGTLFEFEGCPESAATRRVVAVRSLATLKNRQDRAGIPTTYRGALLATWNDTLANPGTLDAVRAYLLDPMQSRYFWGPVGTGKTWAVGTIANELLQRGRSVRFVTASSFLLRVRDTFRVESYATELDVLRPFLEPEFLVLDELGDVAIERERRASEFAVSRLLTLLNERGQNERPTLMTSNLSLGQLVCWAGDERLVSRIRGFCGEAGIIELIGRDLRFEPTDRVIIHPPR